MTKDPRWDASNPDLEEIRRAVRGEDEFKPVFQELQDQFAQSRNMVAQPDERAAFEEIRSALDETYRFASTSSRACENINFVFEKLDEIEKARAASQGAKQ